MADIVTFVDDLDAALRDPATGVNAQLATIDGSVPPLAAIYSTWDSLTRTLESPSLFALHVKVRDDLAEARKRDSWHEVQFLYRLADFDQGARRKAAGRTLQAMLRTVDPVSDQISSRMATVMNVRVMAASTLFARDEDHRDELILADLEFQTRENL